MKILIIVGLLLLMSFTDYIAGKNVQSYGIIIDKQYKPKSSSIGLGTNYKGESIIVTDNESESWYLIAEKSYKNIVTIDTEKNIYYSKNKGDTIYFNTLYGCFSKIVYSNTATR
jgi:hypothetical protein